MGGEGGPHAGSMGQKNEPVCLCVIFSVFMCVNTSYIFLAVPASIAYNYNYGMAGRLETCKRIETGTLTFDKKHTVRRLQEHKIWGKQCVL